ncbi:MAG: nucleotidyltransferase domain-containing protein [Rhodoferax sp.]
MIDLPQDQLDEVRAIVRRHVHGAEVFAFGSRVCGRARRFSDLDLMIKADGAVPLRTMADLREAFEDSTLPILVDVVDWSACSEQFRSQVGERLERIA